MRSASPERCLRLCARRDNTTAKRTLEHAIDLYTGVLSTHMESLATKAYKRILDREREQAEQAAKEAAQQLTAAEEAFPPAGNSIEAR